MTNRNSLGGFAILLAILMAIAFIGCDMESSEGNTGSLEIRLSEELDTRTLKPALDMDAARYVINGTRAGSSDIVGPVDITGATHTFSGIPVGDWTITVEAYNDEDQRIGEGSTTVVLTGGPKAVATIVVVPLTGTGDFTFVIDWTDNDLVSPSINASFTPDGTEEACQIADSDIVIAGTSATISLADLPSGYYDFTYSLMDGEELFAGNFHEVRILAGQNTSGSEELPVYPFEVSVVINMNNPFPVIISSEDFILECANTQTFSVAPADAESYQWYLDGTKIVGANEAVCWIDGEGMAFGWHFLSVKVKKATDWVSSGSVAFYVDDLVGRGGWIDLTITNKADPTDTWEHLVFANGPDEDSLFNDLATLPEGEIPIHIEMMIERAHEMVPASLMVASTIPLSLDADYSFFPADSTYDGDWMYAVLGSWENGCESIVLGVPYDECMFMTRIYGADGSEKFFDSRESFHNPVIDEATGERQWPENWWGDATEGVSITYSRYGDSIGSYVKGTVSGTVISVIPGEGDESDYLAYYTVEGYFVTSRAIAKVTP